MAVCMLERLTRQQLCRPWGPMPQLFLLAMKGRLLGSCALHCTLEGRRSWILMSVAAEAAEKMLSLVVSEDRLAKVALP